MRQIHGVFSDKAGAPGGPYSQAVIVGDLVFLSGSVPNLPDGSFNQESFESQAHTVFQNLAHVAESAGASLEHAIRVGVYLRNMDNFSEMNEIYAQYFNGAVPPARTAISADLPGFEIEVDAILHRA